MIPEWNSFINADCMEYLKEFPDNYFDLAIVDPPYGGGASEDAKDVFKGSIVGRFGGTFEKYFSENLDGGVSVSQGQEVHGRVSTGKK